MANLRGVVEGLIQYGGADVSYTPTLTDGVESGILTINDETYYIYSSKVTVTPVGSTGVKIATITIDGVDYDIYSESGGTNVSVSLVEYSSGAYSILTINVNDFPWRIRIPNRLEGLMHVSFSESQLHNGDVLYWDSLDEEWKSGSIPKINYSTSEQDTGKKWIDGRPIYTRTINIDSITNGANTTVDASFKPSVYDNVLCVIPPTWQYRSTQDIININNRGASGSNGFIMISVEENNGMKVFSSGIGYTATNINFVIEYTKVADLPNE